MTLLKLGKTINHHIEGETTLINAYTSSLYHRVLGNLPNLGKYSEIMMEMREGKML